MNQANIYDQGLKQNQANFDQSLGNANGALNQQQAFVNALGNNNGLSNQNFLAGQLQQQALGQGPNPAAIALQQATNNNIANSAAQVASQRGLNAGTAARLIGQNTANTNQQAAGQGALMQAQQQLAAQSALGNLSGQQVSQQAGGLQNLIAGNQSQAGLNQGAQNALYGQINFNNNLQQQAQLAQQQIQAGVDSQNQKFGQDMFKGAVSGVGSLAAASAGKGPSASTAAAPVAKAHGGLIGQYADGGNVGPRSFVGQHFHKTTQMKTGGNVPGQAKVQGDSYTNDIVDAKLSPGEFVIPRTVVNSNDPKVKAALAIIKAVTERNKRK